MLKGKHFDKINWTCLSGNTCDEAIELLLQHPARVDYESLSTNPNIFERDYISMSKTRTLILLEDFLMDVLEPRRIKKFLDLGGDMDDYLIN
jgi:hypothetical protein